MVFYLINNQINKQWDICSGLVGTLPVGLVQLSQPLFSAVSAPTKHVRFHQHAPCLLILVQGGLWQDQSCGSRPSRSRVAAQMRCQGEVWRLRTLPSWLQRAANWASGKIQDPGDRRHWILHHAPRIWPPGSVLHCGKYYVLVPVKWPPSYFTL